MKKVLSIVLSLVMVICMMPVMAFAATSNAAYSDISGEMQFTLTSQARNVKVL